MNKAKALEVFLELLEAWEESESMVINDRGDIDDFKLMRREKTEYEAKFLEALNS